MASAQAVVTPDKDVAIPLLRAQEYVVKPIPGQNPLHLLARDSDPDAGESLCGRVSGRGLPPAVIVGPHSECCSWCYAAWIGREDLDPDDTTAIRAAIGADGGRE